MSRLFLGGCRKKRFYDNSPADGWQMVILFLKKKRNNIKYSFLLMLYLQQQKKKRACTNEH